MKLLSKEDKEKIKQLILEGKVFIYPTDTIYGLGCDATNYDSVERVREIKMRRERPFSVIAPSKEWILRNCKVEGSELDILPGPYTLVVELRAKCVAENVNLGLKTLGVRIPDHWFSKLVEELNIPVVTTSANISGEKYMTSIDDIDKRIKNAVDFIVYEGRKEGKPSKVIDLTSGKVLRN